MLEWDITIRFVTEGIDGQTVILLIASNVSVWMVPGSLNESYEAESAEPFQKIEVGQGTIFPAHLFQMR